MAIIYTKTVMDSFFVTIMIVAVIVAVLAFVEKAITSNLYRQRYELNKDGYLKIMVPNVPLPCYVYRAKQGCFINDLPINIREVYEKRMIPIHVSSAIQKRLRNTKHCARDIFTVGDPINSIVKTVSNGISIINESDPTQSDVQAKWKMYKPIGYNVNSFVDGDYLYIM